MQCHLMLLKEEIKTKRSIISKQKKDFEIVRNSIKQTVSLFDLTHLSCLYHVCNDSKLVKIKQVHYKKKHALGKNNSIGAHDPDKVIFNYSSYKLCDIEKKILVRGLNFALPPVKLNYRDYLTPFELLFRDVSIKPPVSDNILDRLKVEIKEMHFHHMITIVSGMNLTLLKKNMWP